MVAHGSVCMGDSHVFQGIGSVVAGYPHQQLKVHHVVDYYGKLPAVVRVVPAAGCAYCRVKACRKNACPLAQYTEVGRVAGKAVSVAETAKQLEPDVVVGFARQERLEQFRVRAGKLLDFSRTGIFVQIPQRARIKTAAPPAYIGLHQASARKGARHFAFLQPGSHIGITFRRLQHNFVYQLRHITALLRRGRNRQQQNAQKGSHSCRNHNNTT